MLIDGFEGEGAVQGFARGSGIRVTGMPRLKNVAGQEVITGSEASTVCFGERSGGKDEE